ncbi:MAG: hypothetical protein COU31_04110 [Candidatus Magasanikbacteria bacterium CG10_big_fil_rev_8_21_14_0_10_40_10]|uniref:Uncharacterized protein n=1 Tax=Candidatus Magasanikbacteria bacterium CG10_big_fil_rev_8_21_14_0_10_40_10 TaxID=1974648 RepID=A0A2M6W392_9BACT|nr:MAG: hypothetical protein COU31_04110 [Candidatus Magasanikbacteria bacterium CG10_big_fil_rev_8_21_14_0_10_40_10]
MLKVEGILKRDAVREFTRKNGIPGQSREVFIETPNSVYPVKVNISDMDLKIGKQGDKVSLDVNVFPYHVVDGKRKRAFIDIFIPAKK